MIKVGIRAHDVGQMDPYTLNHKIVEMGFDGIQLVFKKAICQPVDFNQLDDIKQAFSNRIMMLGAYFNPVHPIQSEVNKGIADFKRHLDIAHELKASYVGTETGSLMGSPWGYIKENHNQETLDQVVDIFKDLAQHAKERQVMIAIEGAYAHVAYSPEKVKYIIDQVNSPNLKVTIDLFNFLHTGNYQNRYHIFHDAIKFLKDDIVIFHLKDFIIKDQQLKQVGLGQGLMDHPLLIKTIKDHFDNVFLIFEGVTGKDIESSYAMISELLTQS